MNHDQAHTCDLVYYLAGHKLPSHVCIAYGELIHRHCEQFNVDPLLIIAIIDKTTEWDSTQHRGRAKGLLLLKHAPANPYDQIRHGIMKLNVNMGLCKGDMRKALKALRYDWRAIGLHWKQIDMQINQVCKGVIPMEPMRA